MPIATEPATSAGAFPIERDAATGIATIRLEQPGSPVVVLDLPLIQRIEATLAQLKQEGATGLVLASASQRVFIAGADLKSIAAMSEGELDRYLAYGQRVFGMLCDLPFPTAAAINGAALGGGLEIAMHCDALVGVALGGNGKPYAIGLPEAGLCICPGWGGTNLLPARVNPAEAITRTATGRPWNSEEAAAAGLFDRITASGEDVVAAAKAWITEERKQPFQRRDGQPRRWIGRTSFAAAALAALGDSREKPDHMTDAARTVLECVRVGLQTGWQAALDLERKHLNRLRNTPAGKAAIQAFFDKSKK